MAVGGFGGNKKKDGIKSGHFENIKTGNESWES